MQEPKVTREEAISIAYREVEEIVKEFKANLDERDKLEVSAEITVAHDNLEWVIEIYNAEINREYGLMGFSVIIDAITGKVLERRHTE